MPTVHYLNWQEGHQEASEVEDPATAFFIKMNISDGSGIETVPADWYSAVIEIPTEDAHKAYDALQNDIPLEGTPGEITSDMRTSRDIFTDAQIRSMCAGDILEVDGRLYLICGAGSTEVEWGEAPSIGFGPLQ